MESYYVYFFLAKSKIGFLDGSFMKTDVDSSRIHQWERWNVIVLSWIMNTVSKVLFAGIVYSTSAHTLWRDLKKPF